MVLLKEILTRLYRHMLHQTEISLHYIHLFALVMMINFPLFGVLWKFGSLGSVDEFILRLMTTFCCVLLLSYSFWPKKYFFLFPFIWYFAVFLCLPFFFTYLTLTYHGATAWLMNCVSATFFLMLVMPFIDGIIIFILGISGAFLLYTLQVPGGVFYNPGYISAFSLVITFFAAIIIGTLFSRDRKLINSGKLVGINLLSQKLAESLRLKISPTEEPTLSRRKEILLYINGIDEETINLIVKQESDKILRALEMEKISMSNIQHERIEN